MNAVVFADIIIEVCRDERVEVVYNDSFRFEFRHDVFVVFSGDFVVVVNAEKVVVSGNKETDKIYYHHTGYPGGLKSASVKEVREKDATRLIEKAVKGMLQHNTLGAQQFNKLKVYVGPEHPHAAQNPIVIEKEAK